jgi:hypothetical protein
MNALKLVMVMSCIAIVLWAVVSPCSAQIYPYPFFNPFYAPFFPSPYLSPFTPTLSGFSPLMVSPLLSPYPAALPTLPFRSAAATIITLPAATPVTAYAPLGTLNLTPSTLVLLILYLSLAE